LRPSQSGFEHGLVRGRCARKSCVSRYGIVRLTLDFRDRKRVDQSARLECAACGRVWSGAKVPELPHDVQRHAITLILPPEKRVLIWTRRGTVHREGDDAYIVENATYDAYLDAFAEWHKRNDSYGLAAERRRAAQKAQNEKEAAEFVEWIKGVEARAAERAAAAKELGIA
jgi:hypothetical protein